MSTLWTRGAHSVVSSGPVTVTSINMENIPSAHDQSIATLNKGNLEFFFVYRLVMHWWVCKVLLVA